jgi:hypothetical protein
MGRCGSVGQHKHLAVLDSFSPRLIDMSFFTSGRVRSRVKQCRRLAAALKFGSNRMWSEE